MTARPLRGEVELRLKDGEVVVLRAGIGEFEVLDIEADGGVQGLLDRGQNGGLRIADVVAVTRAGMAGADASATPSLDDARALVRAAGVTSATAAALQLIVVGLGLDRAKKDGGGA